MSMGLSALDSQHLLKRISSVSLNGVENSHWGTEDFAFKLRCERFDVLCRFGVLREGALCVGGLRHLE
jgi:hypothetical protein